MLIFVHTNIKSIRNKFAMLASQVKFNVNKIMISETKLDDAFLFLNVLANLFLKALANPSELIITKMAAASCSLFVKTYQQDLFY